MNMSKYEITGKETFEELTLKADELLKSIESKLNNQKEKKKG